MSWRFHRRTRPELSPPLSSPLGTGGFEAVEGGTLASIAIFYLDFGIGDSACKTHSGKIVEGVDSEIACTRKGNCAVSAQRQSCPGIELSHTT